MIKNNNNNHKKRKLRLDAARLSQLSLSRIIRLPSLTPPLMVLLSFMLLLVALPTDTYAKYILLAVEDSHMKVAGFEHKVSICPEGELPETWQPGHIFHSGIQSKHQWHQPDQPDLQHRGCYRRGAPSALHPFGRK